MKDLDAQDEEIKSTEASELKILLLKQMIQRLPIVLVQVRAGNNSQNLFKKSQRFVTFCKLQTISLEQKQNIS